MSTDLANNLIQLAKLITDEEARKAAPAVSWQLTRHYLLRDGTLAAINNPCTDNDLIRWHQDGTWWQGPWRDIIWCGDIGDLFAEAGDAIVGLEQDVVRLENDATRMQREVENLEQEVIDAQRQLFYE